MSKHQPRNTKSITKPCPYAPHVCTFKVPPRMVTQLLPWAMSLSSLYFCFILLHFLSMQTSLNKQVTLLLQYSQQTSLSVNLAHKQISFLFIAYFDFLIFHLKKKSNEALRMKPLNHYFILIYILSCLRILLLDRSLFIQETPHRFISCLKGRSSAFNHLYCFNS